MENVSLNNYENRDSLQYQNSFTDSKKLEILDKEKTLATLKVNLDNAYNYFWGNKTKLEKKIVKYGLGEKACYGASCFSTILAYFSHEFSKCVPECEVFLFAKYVSFCSAIGFGYGRKHFRSEIQELRRQLDDNIDLDNENNCEMYLEDVKNYTVLKK